MSPSRFICVVALVTALTAFAWPSASSAQLGDRERRERELAEAGTGLFRKTRSGIRIAQPKFSISLRPKNTLETLRLGGLKPRREIRVSLFSGVF